MPPILDHKEETNNQKPSRLGFWLFLFLLVIATATYFTYQFAKSAPATFETTKPFVIEPGTGIRQITEDAKAAGLTHSKWLLYAILLTKFKDTPPQASTYVFERPLSVDELAGVLAKGDHDSNLISITIPEGTSLKAMSKIIQKVLPNFSADNFLKIAVGQEGFLFPETYFVPATYTEDDMYKLLNDTFSSQIKTLEPALSNHNLTLTEIIILASIIEREANSIESMKMVSGILQERMRIGMALQVDASMEYVLDKPLSELTAEDLKTESPYNTYLNPGLPPTPIGNPGLDSIKAVLEPTPSDYLFYITGDDGNFYYARTFDEHRANIARYLR